MSAILRALRLLRWRPGLLLLGAVLLAVGAEASSVALLSVSGWFVVACFVLAGDPGFNYLGPSGAVRALALARIVLRYLQRLVAHTATLRWLTRLRVRLFDDVAALPREQAGRLRTGDLLDRLLRDVETLDELVLRCLVPLASVTAVAGSAVLVLAGVSPAAAAIAAGGWLLAMTATGLGLRAAPDEASARGAARSELVAAGGAWRELAALGAAPALRRASSVRLADLTAVEEQVERRDARARLVTDLGVGLTVLGATWVTAAGDAAITTVAMVALLTTAVGDLLSALGPAMAYARRAVVAARRLELGDEPAPGRPRPRPRRRHRSRSPPARSRSCSPDRRAPARRRCCAGCAASTRPVRATGASCSSRTTTRCSPGPSPTTCASPTPTSTTTRCGTCSTWCGSTAPASLPRRPPAPAAGSCPAVSSAGSPSPARSLPGPTCCCSTSP
ncbi:hypothetical protein GCM10025872_13460 [Barrientosiimonas endolithica]|uniref:ABC transmembrane type-1 domain-containing protein n=1 Tax=Barrientosiimonas endolithica TaxID=1535208 RepID=A0ABN6YJM1_9MICO|nr:hypothetical protein GCM10025872_13460 [Barrientosiimonas endolithica]